MRISTTGTVLVIPAISSRFAAWTVAIVIAGVATALPAAEQMGQICELITPEFISTQQCICAARKMIPSSIATTYARFELLGIEPIVPAAYHTTPFRPKCHSLAP